MSKKRDLDRLGHFLLKFAVVEIKEDIESDDPKENAIDTLRIIASIMQKAESAKVFEFTKKDSNEMTVKDICDSMNIELPNCDDCKKSDEVKEEIQKAAEHIAKKFGLKNAGVVELNLSDEQSSALKNILDNISKGKNK